MGLLELEPEMGILMWFIEGGLSGETWKERKGTG